MHSDDTVLIEVLFVSSEGLIFFGAVELEETCVMEHMLNLIFLLYLCSDLSKWSGIIKERQTNVQVE